MNRRLALLAVRHATMEKKRQIFQRRQEHGASDNLVQEPRYENQENK